MRPSRILFVTHSSSLGGGELSLIDLVSEKKKKSMLLLFSDGPLVDLLKKREVPFEILHAPKLILGMTKGSGFLSVFLSLFYLIFFEFKIFWIMKSYQTIVSNSQKAHFLIFIPNLFLKKKWIVYYRDHLNPKFFGLMKTKLSKFILNNGPTLIIANSKSTQKSLCLSGVSNRIEAVYNYIEFPQSFSPKNNTPKNLKLLYPSRLSAWKGQLEFLDALYYVKKPLAVTMIKDNFFGESERFLIQKIEEKSKRLPNNVELNLVPVQKDMSKLYIDCDVVVHAPSSEEPFGRVLVEAISYSRPLIVSKNATIDGFLKNRHNCAIIENMSPESYALTLEASVQEYGQMLGYAKNAFEESKNLFSKKNTIEEVFRFID